MSMDFSSHFARRTHRGNVRLVALWFCGFALSAMGCQTTQPVVEPEPQSVVQPAAVKVAPSIKRTSRGDTETLTFGPGINALDEAQLSTLQLFGHSLAPDPALRVHVAGSTGSSAAETSKKWLAEQRAKNVASYLTSQGIAPRRVTLQGDSDPTAGSDTGEVVISVR
jgi:OOP family OmpA-OmpF porin